MVAKNVPPWVIKLLDALLSAEDISETITTFKKHPKNFNFKQIQLEVNKHKTYYPLYEFSKTFLPLLEISKQNVEYYASLIHFYNSYRLKELPKTLGHLYLLCYAHNRFQIMNDHLIQTFFHYVDLYKSEAKQYAEKKVAEAYNNMRKYLKQAGTLLNMYTNNRLSKVIFKKVQQKALTIIPKNELAIISSYMMNECVDKESFEWEYHARNYRCIINNLRPIFMLINFDCHANDLNLLDGVNFVKSVFRANKKLNSCKFKEFPKNLIPKRIKPYICSTKNSKKYIDPYKYEFLVYHQLMEHIRQGLVFCNDTIQYKSFESDLGLKDKNEALKLDPALIFRTSSLNYLSENKHALLHKQLMRSDSSDLNRHFNLDRSGHTQSCHFI